MLAGAGEMIGITFSVIETVHGIMFVCLLTVSLWNMVLIEYNILLKYHLNNLKKQILTNWYTGIIDDGLNDQNGN